MKKKNLLMLLGALSIMLFAVSCGDKDNGGAEPDKDSLIVSPTRDILFNAIDNNEVLFTITTNVAAGWELGEIPAWITVTSKTEKNLKIMVVENKDEERSCELTFTAGEAEPVKVNVSQKSGESTFESLTGSDYYVIALDKESEVAISHKITVDYRNQYEFQVWNGYAGGSRVGLNPYGVDYSWVCLEHKGGWAGAGYLSKIAVDWTGLTRDHVFHFAVKGSGIHHMVLGTGGGSNEYKIVFGSGPKDGIDPVVALTDEWQEVEIPVATMLDAGWVLYKNDEVSKNMMSIGTDVSVGFQLNLDAVFFYKPKQK